MSTLEFSYDNVIVGGGLSGLVAALRLNGRTIVLSKAMGATAISTGVLSPMNGDAGAEDWFLSLMDGSGCPYVRGRCMAIGGESREGLVQASMAYEGSPAFIAINEVRPSFTSIEFMKGSSLQEIARALETDDGALDEIIGRLSAIKADGLMLPPILGISRSGELRNKLMSALGMGVWEYVTAPSVLGLRLILALRQKADQIKTIKVLDTMAVDSIADGVVKGHMGTKAKRELCIKADRLFLATGGLLTGFSVGGDRIYEPLTNTTISDDFEPDLNNVFLSEHPLMYKGIGTSHSVAGFRGVRAIGAVASGFGLYRALIDGYHAGDEQ